ncbi:MAG: serine--tRNA ligase [Verrucomicrobia bacterium]|nr:serine--tRNA ligase [Verrucomicrobiota bacterium]
MLELKTIRETPEQIEAALRRRDPGFSIGPIIEADAAWRRLQQQTQENQTTLNAASKEIGALKRQGHDTAQAQARLRVLSDKIAALRCEAREAEEALNALLVQVPNIPDDDVPVSANADDKVVLREHLERPELPFAPRSHLELSDRLGLFDFARAARMAEARFPMYVGLGARLEWALLSFMWDVQVREHGYTPVLPPLLVNETTMFTTGQLPKFEDQLYRCRDDALYLVPTSEAALTSLHRDETVPEAQLPLKYCAYTPCFRREAGTYGAEEKGLIRVHQFNKIEMYRFCTPEQSDAELEALVADAEDIVARLGLHSRTVLLVTSDIAQQAAKTIDIEVWVPAQGRYYEVSSCSNCRSYQAVRGNIRYRTAVGGKNRFMHTLNGSGLATSRLMAALLETNQDADGRVAVPEALRPYLGGLAVLDPKGD